VVNVQHPGATARSTSGIAAGGERRAGSSQGLCAESREWCFTGSQAEERWKKHGELAVRCCGRVSLG